MLLDKPATTDDGDETEDEEEEEEDEDEEEDAEEEDKDCLALPPSAAPMLPTPTPPPPTPPPTPPLLADAAAAKAGRSQDMAAYRYLRRGIQIQRCWQIRVQRRKARPGQARRTRMKTPFRLLRRV